MSNQQLGKFAIQEIRVSMTGLTGAAAKAEAVRLAQIYPVTWQHIYKITKDLRPQKRKTRADKGTSKWRVEEGTDLWAALEFVVVDNLDPDLALLTAKERGFTNLPSLSKFQAILREMGLNRQSRRRSVAAYRRWQSENPGEIFQVDVTALKERWIDLKTRKIIRISEKDVNTNHPNPNPNQLPVWQLMLSDDCSRRRFLRYVACEKVTSDIMVRFLVEAFLELGVPRVLYTDNGSEFKGRHVRAAKILHKVTENDGGYEHWTHKPHNAKATGKVEVAHQFVEKMNKLIGLAIKEGQEVTLEKLNGFADEICRYYNEVRVCRATGETPMARWYSRRTVIRRLPADVIESALLADEFTVTLDPGMTVSHKGAIYKVPGVRPFVSFVGQKVSVVIPPNINVIVMVLPNGEEYEIEKVLATADNAGEFKQTAESEAQQIKKRLKETAKARTAAIKEQAKLTGEIAPVPFWNTKTEVPASNVTPFPHAKVQITAEDVAKVAPVPQSIYSRSISYWEAVVEFADGFADKKECKDFLLTVFGSSDVQLPVQEVEKAIDERQNNQQTTRHLRAV